MALFTQLSVDRAFFKKRVGTAHPQPKMPPNRLTRVGTAKKFVFLQGISKKMYLPTNFLDNFYLLLFLNNSS